MYSKSQPLYLICESSEYPLSSLSIVKKYNKEILNTTVVDGALVHHFGSLQCSDMGTYECLHNNDTSNKATVDVPVVTCPPQPCLHGNKATRIFTALKENVTIDICVMSHANFDIRYIFRNGNRTDMLSKNRYESSITKDNLYYSISVLIRDIQEGDFGKLSVNISTMDHWRVESLIHEILLEKKSMTFTAAGPSGFKYSVSDNISLICESSDYAPSELSISGKGGNGRQQLKTEIVKNTLVYTLDDLQCSDMATYICQAANDTSYNATLDIPIMNCAPQLCPEENQTRPVTVKLNSDLNISICVISDDKFFLERVFLDGKEDKILEKNRYKPYISSEITGEDLYHSVDIEIYNITEEDFGRVTFRLRHVSVVDLCLDYEITLQQTTNTEGLHEIEQNPANESTRDTSTTTPRGNSSIPYEPTTANNDSSMIYMISGVCTFVALVLVGNFIYCQIRKRCFRTSSSQIKKESTDHLPVPSQQYTPYGYSVTLYENAAAEQLQQMLQETDDDGYLRPGPIYESIE